MAEHPQKKGARMRSRSTSSVKKTEAYDTSRSSHVRRKVDRPHRGGPHRLAPRNTDNSTYTRREDIVIPPLDKEGVRIVPLGGVEEVGRNMTVVETLDDLFVIDAGFQFMGEGDAPGIDYVLPNTTYLEERKSKIRALIITHGHLDHIGGIPYVLERMGNPRIYTRYLTSIMIKKRQEEFPHLPAVQIETVEPGDRIKIGNTHITTFPVTHSIPDSMGVKIETKYGNVILTGDLKLAHEDGVPVKEEEDKWTALGKEKNLMFIADSTNAEKAGFSIPESKVHETLEEIVKNTKGRLIIGTFASQFERIINIIRYAEKYNKKVITEGRSIRTNVEIAQKAEILKTKEGTIIHAQDIDNYPTHQIIVLATGAQGEPFAALMRIATKQHKFIRLNERDTVVLSSSVIPGNELSVQKLKDNLYRNGVRLMHYRASDVHSTGHGNSGELAWINNKVGARFFMPAYGYHSMLRCHAQAVMDTGFPKQNIVIPDNGSVIDIIEGSKLVVHKEKAPSSMMMVDGFSVGGVQDIVIRDRKALSQDGMFVIVATLNLRTGKLRKSPDLISRGFVYLRESQGLLQETRLLIKKTIEDATKNMNPVNFDMVKADVADTVAAFLFQKTNKHPIVIPVLLGL
ncbi:MAG TPA: ribonuclease J [Candidatus Paceibacterota bacterium]